MRAGLISARRQTIAGSKNAELQELARSKLQRGSNVIDLSRGELSTPPPQEVITQAVACIREPVHKYTDTIGAWELREQLCDLVHTDTRGATCHAANIAVTAGAKQALFNFALAVLDSGDEVLIPTPYWTTFPEQVKLAGGKPVFVDVARGGYQVDLGVIAQAVSEATRVILLNCRSE